MDLSPAKTSGRTARIAVVFAVGVGVFGAGSLTHAQTQTDPEVRKNLIQSRKVAEVLPICFECHGDGGVSDVPSYPTLAGQKPRYLRRQLMAFKRAARDETPLQDRAISRTDPIMVHMGDALSDDMVEPVATALSKLACDGGNASDQSQTALRRRPEFPDAAGGCVGCHGMDGISRQPDIPNLAGQQRSYLRRQMLLIRETAWGALPRASEAWRSHPIMEQRTARLSIEDIDAVAGYFSALPCNGKPLDNTK